MLQLVLCESAQHYTALIMILQSHSKLSMFSLMLFQSLISCASEIYYTCIRNLVSYACLAISIFPLSIHRNILLHPCRYTVCRRRAYHRKHSKCRGLKMTGNKTASTIPTLLLPYWDILLPKRNHYACIHIQIAYTHLHIAHIAYTHRQYLHECLDEFLTIRCAGNVDCDRELPFGGPW